MNKLKSITLSRLSTSQLRSFAQKMLTLLSHYTYAESFMKRQFDALDHALNDLKDLHEDSRSNIKSKELALLDDEQDSLLIGIREHCKGRIALRRFCPKSAEACETILTQMNEYGRDLLYGNHEKQSVAIPSFLSRMESGTLQKSVIDAEVSTYFETLKEVHKRFHDLHLERLEFVEKPSKSLVETKKKIRYRLDSILLHIDNHLYDSTGIYDGLEGPIDRIISKAQIEIQPQGTPLASPVN